MAHTSKNDIRGSLWSRWDLHFHTPSSFDYHGGTTTNEEIVSGLVSAGVRVVAVTDHHIIDVDRIRSLQKIGEGKLTVLPGIELRGDHGGTPIHYICIFPEDCDLEHVWTRIQGGLGLTKSDIKTKGGDHLVYVPIEQAAKLTRELGGVVSIHAGAKSNSIEGIKNKEQFQQRIKYDITSKYVDLMEIGQIKDLDIHLNMIFPETGLDKPLIICSDSHDVKNYSVKVPLWFKADATFRGLLMVLREPRGRVHLGSTNPDQIRLEQNTTKYISKISFAKTPGAPTSEKWFSGELPLNSGLVAIVGNKGSGKSALSDMLGLLGASKNHESFSFLRKERFRHPTGGFATHFEATLEWLSGEKGTKSLAEVPKVEEVERLKYLPQDHVEKVCNELSGIGERNFERELKAVIFSHVPIESRLDQDSLDALVRFRTGEKQRRIDALVKQLRDVSRSRSAAELQSDPTVRKEIQEKISRKEVELKAHEQAKPTEKVPPSNTTSSVDSAAFAELTRLETNKAELVRNIELTGRSVAAAERKQAVAKRLIERMENFQKEFDVFLDSLEPEAVELGIKAGDLATFTINKSSLMSISNSCREGLAADRKALDETDPLSLSSKLKSVEVSLTEIRSKLDAPNREYQAYLQQLKDWERKKTEILGDEKTGDSLLGLKASLAGLERVPKQIQDFRAEMVRVALQILSEKQEQAKIYRSLYQPVQNFIDTHALAKDKLKLEFRAELSDESFTEGLLGMLAQNRRGSFMGVEEGRMKAETLAQAVNWESAESVAAFLEAVDNALHYDQREKTRPAVLLKDQLAAKKKMEDVFDFLFSISYVEPRYILRWEGKDISMLSPGERGTLLLVFYLLIDKGDMPLIIDQPEGNLDNHTVAKVLVDCIREARKRRQVFIVTHNPNLAVVCDADQIIHASIDKTNGNAVTYTSGSLENPAMGEYVTDVLEGTRWAFGVRGDKYKVSS